MRTEPAAGDGTKEITGHWGYDPAKPPASRPDAALARLRRLAAGESADAVYPGLSANDLCFAASDDGKALVDAYAADHPADDGEPVAREWLQSIGWVRCPNPYWWQHESGRLALRAEPGLPLLASLCEGMEYEVFLPSYAVPQNRGEFRRLFAALKIVPA